MEVFQACTRSEWGRAAELFALNPHEAVLYKDRQRWTILHEACNRTAPIDFVEQLLSKGLDPNAQNLMFKTCLHYAVVPQTSADLVALLLHYGANPNLADKAGKTAMHWAAVEAVSPEVLRLLLAARGDLSKLDDNGQNTLHLAIEHKCSLEFLRIVLRFGGRQLLSSWEDARATNCVLSQALLLSSPAQVIQLLLQNGATLNTQRMRVARFHADAALFSQVERAQLFTTLRSASVIKRWADKSDNFLRLLPCELLRALQTYLFPLVTTHVIAADWEIA